MTSTTSLAIVLGYDRHNIYAIVLSYDRPNIYGGRS